MKIVNVSKRNDCIILCGLSLYIIASIYGFMGHEYVK